MSTARNRREADQTPPHIKHPILALAEILRHEGHFPKLVIQAFLAPRIGLEKFDECVAKLIELRQVKEDGVDLVWVGTREVQR